MRKKIEDESQRRTIQVNCALTKNEAAVIDERRGAVSRAEFIRLAAFNAPPPPKIPDVNLEIWTRLAPMSANLNQIARHLNAGDSLETQICELRTTVAELRLVLIGEITPEPAPTPALTPEPQPQPQPEQPAEPEPEPTPESPAPQTTGDDLRGFSKPRTLSFGEIQGRTA